jgi:hypothetical protein
MHKTDIRARLGAIRQAPFHYHTPDFGSCYIDLPGIDPNDHAAVFPIMPLYFLMVGDEKNDNRWADTACDCLYRNDDLHAKECAHMDPITVRE